MVNARLNGVANTSFVAGKAEAVLPTELRKCSTPRAVAIVDPPRAGLHRSVVGALRSTPGLTRLVYIACSPDSLARDGAMLCGARGPGKPFVPVRAAAVDLFPHTSCVEAVMLLER